VEFSIGFDRRPPYDEDAEQAVLGAVLNDPACLVALALSDADFYRESNRRVYRAMRSLQTEGKVIDPFTLSDELDRNGELRSSGGKDYIADLIDAVPTSANAKHHAEIVRRHASRRRLIELASSAMTGAYESDADPMKLAAQLQESLLPFATSSDGRGFRPMREVVIETLEQVEARGNAAREGKILGVTTGYPEIDDIVQGFRPGECVSLFAGPKQGKTALTLAVALFNSLHGDGCGFVCAEMTRHSLVERSLASVGRFKVSEISRGLFDKPRWQKLVDTAADLSSCNNFFIDDEAFPEIGDVIARVLHLKSEHPKIPLIVVDYLQLITNKMQGRRGDEEINDVCKKLKGLAKRAEVVIWAPGQTNFKEVDSRAVQKPMLKDMQGASGPAQTCDFVFLGHRPNMNAPEMPDILEIELAASRRTERFTTQLHWAGQYMRVESPRAVQFAKHWEAA
jgi:replicative DNA helicase